MNVQDIIRSYHRKKQEGRERREKQLEANRHHSLLSRQGLAHASRYYSIAPTAPLRKTVTRKHRVTSHKSRGRSVGGYVKGMLTGYSEIYGL